jgi:hypothetical protein
MARKLSGPDHLDQAHECLDGLVRARREADWSQVAALAAAAQAHLGMAEFARSLLAGPAAVVAGRQGQRWLDAAGVEVPR